MRDHGISLLGGWLPVAVQLLAGVALAAALYGRPRRWLFRWVPALTVLGIAAALLVRRYVQVNGLAGDPAPAGLWVWTGLAAAALPLVMVGWRGLSWPRRGGLVLVVPLTLACVGLMLNTWVGYFPTVTEAWSQLTEGPLPDQVAAEDLPGMVGTPQSTGRVVGVDIPATASHFAHREEYVYLPPAWFAAQRPQLPLVLMIGGEFNTPADWIRVGDAVKTADDYAAQHQGVAPILVFADSGGSFNNDTECVNGPRGNVADYLTKDLPGYLIRTFHPAAPPAWGVVGWSAGGTCAVDLAVLHPELFGTFEDIAGDLGPNTGDRARTVAQLYGGNQDAWASFDPLTVLSRHDNYVDTAGWFVNATQQPFGQRPGGRRAPPGGLRAARGGVAGYGGRPDSMGPTGVDDAQTAQQLCAAASARAITCAVHTLPGRHSWQFAASAFRDALPWLATRLGLPTTAGPSAR